MYQWSAGEQDTLLNLKGNKKYLIEHADTMELVN